MKKGKTDYIQNIKSALRKVNRENLETFEFSKRKEFIKVKEHLFYNLPFDLSETLNKYIDLVIEHILEIRKDDSINVFAKGLICGIEFEQFLRQKHEKDEQ